MSGRRSAQAMAIVLVTTLAAAGCAGLPESGPVVEAGASSTTDDRAPSDIVAVPPQPGESAIDVSLGFLEAMTASPIRVDVARQFLSASAADEWDPQGGTTTYVQQLQPSEEGLRVTVPLVDAARLGRDGTWQGALPADRQKLDLDLTVEEGEYRITNPPEGLVVPSSWFVQRFQQASLYFFDPSGRVLVPQPVFVPRGEQLASTLIARLLEGPAPGSRRVIRSFLPPGLTVAVGVPVSVDGLADIGLVGQPGAIGPDAAERAIAQLAWTLRQVPGISALRVSVGGEPLRTPQGETDIEIDDVDGYDPLGAGAGADDGLYGLRDGVLGARDGNELVPVPGPFGEPTAIRSATVSVDARRAAAVSDDGTRLRIGPLASGGGPLRRGVLTGTDLLPPAWDALGRTWVVDRTASGAVVHYVDRGRVRRIRVPGVTGRRVSAFLVSRDGTRFAAVVRGTSTFGVGGDGGDDSSDGDELRIGRVEVDARGLLDRVGETTVLDVEPGLRSRIRAIAWTSPTTIAALLPVQEGEIFEVRTVSVDGAPLGPEARSVTVTGRISGLVGSPDVEQPLYAVARTSLLDLSGGGSYGFVDGRATSISYAGG